MVPRTLKPAIPFALALALLGCAPVRGFPDDPADQTGLNSFTPPGQQTIVQIYGPASETDYDLAPDNTTRTLVRNQIVRRRLAGYDRTYSAFKRRLTMDGNIVTTGGGLAALVLGGLGATSGNLGTSTALAAAAAGIVGAQGIINRDLYFQRTLPALVAQMDASRDHVLAAILTKLKRTDSDYSLTDANADLQRLKDSGSIEAAINTINQSAGAAKQDAEQAIDRLPSYVEDRPSRIDIGQQLLTITGPRAVALANAMLTHLGTASPEGRAAALRILPETGRFAPNQYSRANQFLRDWADQETMTPARTAIWTNEIQSTR